MPKTEHEHGDHLDGVVSDHEGADVTADDGDDQAGDDDVLHAVAVGQAAGGNGQHDASEHGQEHHARKAGNVNPVDIHDLDAPCRHLVLHEVGHEADQAHGD